jgi:hypothetical protein
MINQHPIEECIRGRLATLVFKNREGSGSATNDKPKKEFGFEILPEDLKGGPGLPKRLEQTKGKFVPGGLEGNDTEALWKNFLDCVRSRNRETLSTPELGAAAFTTVNMGVQSYRTGQVLFWEKEQRKPVPADSSWAGRWQERSKKHGKPNQILGWEGGDRGSVVIPPDYQKLAGPWTNGKDPANGVASRSG